MMKYLQNEEKAVPLNELKERTVFVHVFRGLERAKVTNQYLCLMKNRSVHEGNIKLQSLIKDSANFQLSDHPQALLVRSHSLKEYLTSTCIVSGLFDLTQP
jgi:hypothetical protein